MRERLLVVSLIIALGGCKPLSNQQPIQGCMDPNSASYNPDAKIDDRRMCYYGGGVSIYRTSTGNSGDMVEFWIDSANGKGLKLDVSINYNGLPTSPYPCNVKNSTSFGLPLSEQVYQIKKHLANGQIINVTQPKKVIVTNKYCDSVIAIN